LIRGWRNRVSVQIKLQRLDFLPPVMCSVSVSHLVYSEIPQQSI